MQIIKQTQMNKMQNETLHIKRTKESRLIINDRQRNLINSIFLLFFLSFFLFNTEVGEFRETSYQKLPSHNLLKFISPTLVKFKFGC